MKKTISKLALGLSLVVLASCNKISTSNSLETSNHGSNTLESATPESSVSSSQSSSENHNSTSKNEGGSIDNSVYDGTESTSNFSITTSDGLYSKNNNIYTISSYGTYTLNGALDGQIYVDVEETADGKSTVELELNNVSITYNINSPIFVASADEVKIKALKETYNVINDTRALKTEDIEEQGEGAIYSKCDMKFAGSGVLIVNASYNNGVHSTDDLEIKNIALKTTAPNNAIKGNDSISIESGSITAISSGGDGLKTSNSKISSKGNQKGSIDISGGNISIYSACDGIDASYDVNISDNEAKETSPKITIYTNKYSDYSGEVASPSTETMYLRTTSNNYRYACYFYDTDSTDGTWADSTYVRSSQSGGGMGGRTTYYYYSVKRPANAKSLKVYAFNSSQTTNSLTNYVAASSGQTINTNYDTATVTLSGSNITLGWTNYSSGQGGMGPGGGFGNSGNNDKADYSAKGIKANNNINISGGSIYIKAYDDGLHANYGEALENGSTSTGDIIITGGNTTVYASDDGFHADRYLKISGGINTVEYSYEAFEGNQIYISGGINNVYATDDAINASNNANTARLNATINISGGYTFAAVSLSGDTDCIDSNGTYVQTGGIMIACGPNSSMSSALDTDGAVTISGGSLVLFGSYEKTPTLSNGVTKSTQSGTYSNKVYTITYNNGEVITTQKLPNQSYKNINSFSVNGTISNVA
ncbi:MAG: carbohydrate-binding domain-containing protein [Erysipelotrichales bacterium]|nr:carbohydrate-binding domain-containing protein [Erysipelotrichales bacterium]